MFKKLLKRLIGVRNEEKLEAKTKIPASAEDIALETHYESFPLDINLGIDFGTAFTKVCFRDLGEEKSAIINFGANLEDATIPSVVCIDDEDRLFLSQHADIRQNGADTVPYLKMLLADLPLPVSLPHRILSESNYELKIEALSSWFLSRIFSMAQDWILENESDRCKGRAINWSANVCVPVEFIDSPMKRKFEEVSKIAWYWTETETTPATFTELVDAYSNAKRTIDQSKINCHVLEEVVAAVQSFINSRSATTGAYAFFDIGGGTVDSVTFKYVNRGNLNRINCLSAIVKPLGVSSISHRIAAANNFEPVEIEGHLIGNNPGNQIIDRYLEEQEIDVEIKKLVGEVLIYGSKKDTCNWQKEMENLPIFLAGGGSVSMWYRNAIESTYVDFNHENAGIPEYRVSEIPIPSDLDMYNLPKAEFRRFSVAYGLSIPFGEIQDVGLPSEFKDHSPSIAHIEVPPYSDTKELT